MIKYLNKTMHYINHIAPNKKDKYDHNNYIDYEASVSASLEENIIIINQIMHKSGDIVIRRFRYGKQKGVCLAVVFLDGMVNKESINENIIKPFMYDLRLVDEQNDERLHNSDYVENNLLAMCDVKDTDSFATVINALLYGHAIVFIDGSKAALLVDIKGWEGRNIEEPSSEQTVRGPREGFVETLRFNTALLRRRILDPRLVIEQMTVGEKTKTHIALIYLNGVTKTQIIEEVKKRLSKVDTDAILDSGTIEQYIEDAPYSPFTTIGNSEKPDIVAAKILEGRAAILVDGSPVALTVPYLFVEAFQAGEDYYSRPYYTSLIRLIRYLAFFISLLAPAWYVAVSTYHQELIPTPLLITMKAASEGTPFPAALEAFLMVIIFEILREGGVRLPSQVGQALSIVGALVIGSVAVEAGLVGAPMVIVLATTAIASFLVRAHIDAIALLRIIALIMASIIGVFGITFFVLVILVHLAGMRSFLTPYLWPIAPLSLPNLKDVFIRVPIRTLGEKNSPLATEYTKK